jgi:hypothetical protein
MTITELKNKLYWANVPERWYSLNDGLKANACILMENYGTWEFFFLDEKGDRHDWKNFSDVESAYDHLWKKMEYQLGIFKIKPRWLQP